MSTGFVFSPAMAAAVMALAGLALGLVYFRVLQWTVDLYTGSGSALLPAALTLARIAGAVVLLVLIAQHGAAELLGGFVGFLAARTIALRRAHRAP